MAIQALSGPTAGSGPAEALRYAAGRISAIAASVSSVACERAPAALKRCSLWRRPPASIAAPSTSRMFPTMEPTSEAFTTVCRPVRSAAKAMISSAALPNVALSRPPTPSPSRVASCSVACPIQPASGTIASADAAKIARCRSGASHSSASVIGTNTSSQLMPTSPRASAAELDRDQDERDAEQRHEQAGAPLTRAGVPRPAPADVEEQADQDAVGGAHRDLRVADHEEGEDRRQ